MGRHLSKSDREKRDKRAIELYQQGISPTSIHLRLGVDVSYVLKKYGIEPTQRGRK